MFWPVVGILGPRASSTGSAARWPFSSSAVWAVALLATEFLYNHDIYGGAWARFNSTLKWWQWVYAGVILTLGALNLGSKSRLCRYGTLVLLLPTLVFGFDLGVRNATESVQKAGLARAPVRVRVDRARYR